MSEYIFKRHSKSILLYHLIFPIKYRRSVISEHVERSLVEICNNLSERYEIYFIEIGADSNHVHFLIQSIPSKSVSEISRIVKSITAKEIFRLNPEVKHQLWGGQFWSDGYYVNTVSVYANEEVIKKYVQQQGNPKEEYKPFVRNQLSLFV
jgi:REP element-mobilizing transposase RayT